jgi:hypothetical protein
MLRDVIVHLLNEQPMLADLLSEPEPSDGCIVCTNLRTMNGKAPVFVDDSMSTFIFPFALLRFVEIRAGLDREPEEPSPEAAQGQARPARRLKSGGNGHGEAPMDAAAAEYAPIPPDRLARIARGTNAAPDELEAVERGLANASARDDTELLRRVRDA